MKQVRPLARLLFLLSRGAAILFGAVIIYVTLALATESPSMMERSGDMLTVFFPFTRSPFLLLEDNNSYIRIAMSIIALYTVFLWLLSDVFRTFSQQKLFTAGGVKRLTTFYLFNIGIPIVFVITMIIASESVRDATIIGVLHLTMAVFAYFMAAIFKQGVALQEEQDLTL